MPDDQPAQPSPPSDPWVIRGVVYMLGALAIVGTTGLLIAWCFTKETPPEGLLTIAAGAAGSLGSLLARAR